MEFNSKYNDKELVEILYNNGKLNCALLRDYENRRYDIMAIMYYHSIHDFEIIGYLYGGENYCSEHEALTDNAKPVMELVKQYMNEV